MKLRWYTAVPICLMFLLASSGLVVAKKNHQRLRTSHNKAAIRRRKPTMRSLRKMRTA